MNEPINKPISLTTQELHQVLTNRVAQLSSYKTSLANYANFRRTGKVLAGYSTPPAMPTDQHVRHLIEAKDAPEQMARLAYNYYCEMFDEISRSLKDIESMKDKPMPKPEFSNTNSLNQFNWPT